MEITLKEHLAKIAAKGGKSRSAKKLAAIQNNLRKAREMRHLKTIEENNQKAIDSNRGL